jgi:hypothetical protein
MSYDPHYLYIQKSNLKLYQTYSLRGWILDNFQKIDHV